MRKLVVALFLLCAAVSPSALRASMVDYHFSFTNLTQSNGNPLPSFSFDIVTPGFITTETISTLLTADPTSAGFNVGTYGEDMEGFFGFFQSGGGVTDVPGNQVEFNGTSFDFAPNVSQTDFYQTLGTFGGTTIGTSSALSPSFFGGTATLTITPEPSTFALLGTGLSSLMYFGRRRFLRS